VAGFEATRVVVADRDGVLPTLGPLDRAGRRHRRALVLARSGRRPYGVVDLELGDGLEPHALAAALDAELGPVPAPWPLRSGRHRAATVVIATRDRPDSLARTLDSVLALEHPAYDVVVVDNAPADDRTRRLVEGSPARYVREDRPGLARAHNAALPHVTGEIVAITDDDVVVDRHWLRHLDAAFDAADDVACVTGMIFPAELETPVQAWIEAHAGFGKGFERRVVDTNAHRPPDRLFPFTTGQLGSGANMAFTRVVLEELGGFDPALGVGTPARGGDDLAAFYDVLRCGHQLVYEPAALVLHHHHDRPEAVRRMAYGYGVALGAYLTRTVAEEPRALLEMVARLPGGVRHGVRTTRPPAAVAAPGLAGL